ncbi:MAG: PKD domain-containing protein [Acidimicrobiales bacterium]
MAGRTAWYCFVAVALLPAVPTAWAEEGEASGCIRRDGICVTVRAAGRTTTAPTRRRASDSPLVWRQITVPEGCPNISGASDILAPPDTSLIGRPLVVRRLVDTRTGDTVKVEPAFCPKPAAAPVAAQLAQAIRNSRQLSGAVGVDPVGDGLTGLETWLWAEVPTALVSVAAGLRGFTGQASATAVRFRWAMGDGATYTSTTPGSRESPAARHIYQSKGDYTMALTITWRGSFAATRNGVAAPPANLGEVEVPYQRTYHVVEARGVRQ